MKNPLNTMPPVPPASVLKKLGAQLNTTQCSLRTKAYGSLSLSSTNYETDVASRHQEVY